MNRAKVFEREGIIVQPYPVDFKKINLKKIYLVHYHGFQMQVI